MLAYLTDAGGLGLCVDPVLARHHRSRTATVAVTRAHEVELVLMGFMPRPLLATARRRRAAAKRRRLPHPDEADP